jgi:homoserine dehydrogenase
MKQIPVILFGAGGVGQALLGQIIATRAQVAKRAGARFQVVAVADSQTWRWQTEGLDDTALQELAALKRSRQPLGAARPETVEAIAGALEAGLQRALVVDVTAAEGMEAALETALDAGYGVVLANKKPLAGPWATAQRFFDDPRVRHESTVGGGQPVIATLRTLMDTGDAVYRIEGQLSGTLGYICRRLDEGTRFSVALAAAKARGYTEPDPREDLGGKDVMRKLLILGRMASWPMEAADIEVESLYPPALAHLDVNEFMLASLALDPSLEERVNAAGAAGEVLRYVAELEDGRGRVGLKPVPVESPLANLKYVSFRTERYDDEPLLIGGKGAGVAMTAAGVLGDMIALAREMPWPSA